MMELQGPLLQEAGEDGLHVIVCCLDNGDDQITEVLGASMMAVTSKDDPQPSVTVNDNFHLPNLGKSAVASNNKGASEIYVVNDELNSIFQQCATKVLSGKRAIRQH